MVRSVVAATRAMQDGPPREDGGAAAWAMNDRHPKRENLPRKATTDSFHTVHNRRTRARFGGTYPIDSPTVDSAEANRCPVSRGRTATSTRTAISTPVAGVTASAHRGARESVAGQPLATQPGRSQRADSPGPALPVLAVRMQASALEQASSQIVVDRSTAAVPPTCRPGTGRWGREKRGGLLRLARFVSIGTEITRRWGVHFARTQSTLGSVV